MSALIRPRAREDIVRQFRWYLAEQDLPDTASRFIEAVQASIEQLVRTPNIGALRELHSPRLTGLRVWPVRDFDELLIFYVADGTNVKVIRILHGRRDLDRILKTESTADDQCH